MTGYWVQTLFLRLVLPLFLLAACVIRPSVFSLVYGILCILAFVVPMKRHRQILPELPVVTRLYLTGTLVIAVLFSLALTIFHVVLVASHEVADKFKLCTNSTESPEVWSRFFGLIVTEGAEAAWIARVVLPEPLALVGALAAYLVVVVCGRPRATDHVVPQQAIAGSPVSAAESSLPTTNAQQISVARETMFRALILLVRTSEILWLTLLCLSGVIWPCLISVVYFLLFLALVTWWAMYKTYSAHGLRYLKGFTIALAGCQLGAIYVCQIPFVQYYIDFDSLAMRLVGLRRLTTVKCDEPADLFLANDVEWPDYANPIILFIYCVYTAIQVHWVSWMAHEKDYLDVAGNREDRQGLIGSTTGGDSDDDVILHSAQGSVASVAGQPGAEAGASSRRHPPPLRDRGFSVGTKELAEDERLGLVIATIIRHSYALALITMMAWAVTYHSWLTLVFLLLACILWMIHDTRRACMVTSPFIVAYAECLLIIQYVFCLKLKENELPSNAPGSSIPLSQIGLIKPQHTAACIPLIVEVAYSVPFWLTMRLFFRQRYTDAHGGPKPSRYGTFMQQHPLRRATTFSFNERTTSHIAQLFNKYWIYLCVLVILLVAMRYPITAYGIVYMLFFALLVCFVLISLNMTRRLMFLYWFLLLCVSVVVLLTVYVYQFPQVPEWWKNATGLRDEITKSLGLEVYSVGQLFYRLITPISFLVVVVLQLKFFHRNFLGLTDLTRARRRPYGAEGDDFQDARVELTEAWHTRLYRSWVRLYKKSANIIWRFVEIHISKLTAFALMYLAITQPAAVHFPLVVISALMCFALPRSNLGVYKVLSILACILVAAVLVAKMLFQMPFVPDTFASKNCTLSHFYSISSHSMELEKNGTLPTKFSSAAAWAGFEKTTNTFRYLSGHVLVLVCLGIQAVVYHRQAFHRTVECGTEMPHGLIFPGASRSHADGGMVSMMKYLANYAFYRFGVEITFIMATITISIRMDAIAVIYAFLLLLWTVLKFRSLHRIIWPIYTIFLAIILPLQYASVVGLPPTECVEYPWPTDTFGYKLVVWLYLPDYLHPPNAKLLIPDFFQLLFACCQLYVFHKESPAFDGGDNTQIVYDPQYSQLANPLDDFITRTRTYLDLIKVIVFQYFHWISLVIVFVAGVGGINLFALGYLLSCFILLWKGNELFLNPMRTVYRYWWGLLVFTAIVIFLKTALQVVGCVYYDELQKDFCWLIQLFSIVCLSPVSGVHDDQPQCPASQSEARIVYDAMVFGFILFQLRIFGSHYFRHAVSEFRAQKTLASCGAAYINAMMKREIQAQIAKEQVKMQRIQEQIDQIQTTRMSISAKAGAESSDTYAAMKRGGDYYMFSIEDRKREAEGIEKFLDSEDTEGEPLRDAPSPDSAEKKIDDSSVDGDSDSTPGPMQRMAAAVDHDFDLQKIQRMSTEHDGSPHSSTEDKKKRDYPGSAIVEYVWSILRSGLVMITKWFNRWSQNYRYVAGLLDEEKSRIKHNEHEAPSCLLIPAKKPNDELLESITVKMDEGFYKNNVFVQFLEASYYLAVSRTEVICYLFMVLNNMRSASILSLFFPLMAFLWGTLSAPRPPKIFWVTLITYTEAIIVLKFLFQFEFFPWNVKIVSDNDAFYPPRILGIEKRPSYALWDIILLMFLFYHRYQLRVLGLWKDVEWVDDTASESHSPDKGRRSSASPEFGTPSPPDEIQLHEIERMEKGGSSSKADRNRLETDTSIPHPASPKGENTGYCGYCIKFFHRLIHPLRWYLQDLYTLMFMCDLVCFIILVFGYSSFGTAQGNMGGVMSVIQDNKVPLPFILMLLAQFTLIVIDRALYLKHSQVGRVTYHFFLAVLVHILFFFVLPKVTENPFNRNVPAQIWYFFKCVYFILSAWQIRSGYPDRTLGNFLTKHYNMLNMILFKVFMAIPFLFELRTIMDWIWTDTCMPLFDYIKMENIYAYAYSTKCGRRMEKDYPFPVGEKRGAVVKYGMGLSLLLLIILVLWLPLLLFSLLNTIGERNPPAMCTLHIGIEGYPPFFEGVAQGNFLAPISVAANSNLSSIFGRSRTAVGFLSDYGRDDIMKANFPYDSYLQWTVAPPTKTNLINQLKGSGDMTLFMSWEFARPARGSQGRVILSHLEKRNLFPGSKEREMLVESIESPKSNVTFNELYFPFVEVPPSGTAHESMPLVSAACEITNTPCTTANYRGAFLNVTLKQVEERPSVDWWQASVSVPGYLRNEPSAKPARKSIYLMAFVSKVFPSALDSVTKGGIIGVYVVVVYAIGRIIRGFVTGSLSEIMWDEVPNIDYVLKLCLDIFLVREAKNFETELVLFSKLLFLFRSPATMIDYTRPKTE